MSYLGFIRPIFHSYVNKYCKNPKVLEIGIDRGQSTIPIAQNLIYAHESFELVCIDVKVNHTFIEQVGQLSGLSVEGVDKPTDSKIRIYQENSLSLLTKFLDLEKRKFDLVFIDGDHNYITVLRELELVKNLIKETSIIICDDFNGRWAEKDLFYSERPGYEDLNLMERHSVQGKHGVRPAVLDFIESNHVWAGWCNPEYEPVILYRADVWKHLTEGSVRTETGNFRDAFFDFRKIQENP